MDMINGVHLNPIHFKRPTLNLAEAVVVWLLRFKNEKQQDIASMLGTNIGRVNEVLKQQEWPEARSIAEGMTPPGMLV